MGVTLLFPVKNWIINNFPHTHGGEPINQVARYANIRVSPYYMGVILRYIATLLKKGYFPHASGGDSQIEGMKNQAIGFSPYYVGVIRMSSTAKEGTDHFPHIYVGVIPQASAKALLRADFPHIYGGDSAKVREKMFSHLFSPYYMGVILSSVSA